MTRSIGQLAPVRWNVGVPALIGFVPLALFSIAYPPSSEPWWEHPESMLPVVLCVVGGVATGLLGLRHDTRLRHVAWTFWFTQGAGLSLLSADPTSPGGLVGTFLVAAMLTLALGVLPMTVTFALCAVVRSSARQPPPTVLGPDARSVLDRGLCSRCGKPLDPSSWGQCLQCGASQDV